MMLMLMLLMLLMHVSLDLSAGNDTPQYLR